MMIDTKAGGFDWSFPLLVFLYKHNDCGYDHRNHHGNT